MAGGIVVGVGGDGDGGGSGAAQHAARLARALGVPVVLVFGYEALALGPRGGSLEDEIAAVGRQATSAIRDELVAADPGLDVEIELVADRPVESLISVAEARGADMIVVGHGGRGPLRAALLGSITYEIVHRAPVPVLVVPDTE
jgi:nucleotide-binding universal stress UspA family protein